MTSYKASLPPNMAQLNAQKLQESARSFDAETNGVINDNTDRHDAFSGEFNRNRHSGEIYTNDSMMFSIDSPINDRRLEQKYKRMQEIAAATTATLKDVANEISDPETGKTIINANYNNVWFCQHVYMLFSMGRIFDRNDQEFYNTVNTYFDADSGVYLNCYHDTMNYKDDLVKKVERQIGIDNGNYHLLLVLIVYGKPKELENPPEYLFASSGIVKWAIEADEIKEIMMTFLGKYGLVTQTEIPHKIPARISGRRDDNTLMDQKFKLHSEIDWNSEPNRMLFSDLDYRNHRDEDFAQRQRMCEDPRISGKRERPSKNRTAGTLYQQIHNASQKADTVPQYAKQVIISKMVENTMPSDYIGAEPYNTDKEDRDNKRVRHYQIYDDRSKTPTKTPVKPNPMSGDYSMLYDYGVDAKLDLKSTGVKRPPGRVVQGF